MIIDAHTHIFPREVLEKRQDFFEGEPAFNLLYSAPGSRMAGAEDLLRNMDEQGIDRSVVFGFPWETPDYYKRNNDCVLEAVERHRDRLIGFCTLEPLAEGAEAEVERCLKAGLSGVGELAFYTADITEEAFKRFKSIAEMARCHDVPILLHANESVGHYYAGKSPVSLKEIYDLVRRLPENRFILAHWGGGLFFYHLMKKEVKEVLKNTWFDTAASPFLYDREIYPLAVRILGLDRILFGSDYPLIRPGRYFREMKSVLPPHVLEKVCGGNAAGVLKTDKSA